MSGVFWETGGSGGSVPCFESRRSPLSRPPLSRRRPERAAERSRELGDLAGQEPHLAELDEASGVRKMGGAVDAKKRRKGAWTQSWSNLNPVLVFSGLHPGV